MGLHSRKLYHENKQFQSNSPTSIKSHAASQRLKNEHNKYKEIIDQAIIRENQSDNSTPTTKSYPSSWSNSAWSYQLHLRPCWAQYLPCHSDAMLYSMDLSHVGLQDHSAGCQYKLQKLATTSSAENNPFLLSQVEQNFYSALSVAREENASLL